MYIQVDNANTFIATVENHLQPIYPQLFYCTVQALIIGAGPCRHAGLPSTVIVYLLPTFQPIAYLRAKPSLVSNSWQLGWCEHWTPPR